jgi:hypothetical protein
MTIDKHRDHCCPHCVVRNWWEGIVWRLDWRFAVETFLPGAQA